LDRQTRMLEEALYHCNKCGFCQATCSFYQSTREEWTVARGRLRLMKAVMEGQLAPSDRYAKCLYECFTCGACTANCPSGVEVEQILLEARAGLASTDLFPQPLARLGQTVVTSGNLTGEPASVRLSWTQNLEFAPRQGGKHDLIYFVGCVSSLYPQAFGLPQNMVKLLEWAGADYAILGGEEVCCGYPLFISGLQDQARELARASVARVRETGASRLVTTCPSCFRAWREFYPRLLGEDLELEIIHSTQWLLEAGLAPRPLEKKVTYHDPCDLGRGSGIYESPREFLSSLDGLQLVEMPYARAEALCCGGGGNMESLNSPTSRSVVQMRVQQARATGAELLITACPQCKRTLTSVRSAESRMPVMDIVELAWRSVSPIQWAGGTAALGRRTR
jgi:heterodisulfide reductase subunit D